MENLIKELDNRVEKKMLSKSTKGGLAIYCYSPKCVYEKAWDKYTKMARGLIVNVKTGEIVGRPFQKFFNLNETEETKLENLPMEDCTRIAASKSTVDKKCLLVSLLVLIS